MQIITDHKEKLFKYRYEVPEKILKDQFSYIDEEDGSDNFLQYRGYWYHLSDFLRVEKERTGTDLIDWDGYVSDSAFSGIVIKLPKFKTETYIIGRYWT